MSETQPQCIYTRLDNGIHRFAFNNSDNQAVDECLAHMDTILEANPPGKKLLFLYDLRGGGIPSLRYSYKAVQEFNQQHPVVPEIKSAYIYQDNALLSFWQKFIGPLQRNAGSRFFDGKNEGSAIAWLLE